MVLMAGALLSAGACLGQDAGPVLREDPQPDTRRQEPGDTGQAAEELNEPVAEGPAGIGLKDSERDRSLGEQTLLDDVLLSPENPWGFSLSAFGSYTTDMARSSQRQPSGIAAFLPRTFFNFGKRKSRLHFDLGSGYRFYLRNSESSWDYYGNAQYSYRWSEDTSLEISNQFTSSFNDSWSFVSLSSPLHRDLDSSNEVLFNRQRINRNAVRASLRHSLNRKTHLSAFSGYRMYRYTQNSLRASDAIDVGGGASYEVRRWLHISTSASTYFNLTGNDSPNAKIYHIQAGGLEFYLTNSWRVWASAGLDVSDYERHTEMGENVDAGLSYTSQKLALNLSYQRSFTSGIGIARLLQSQVSAASLGYRITPWMSARVESYYYRSSEPSRGGTLETLSGGGGLEFGLRPDLVVTTNAYYQNQRTNNFSVDGLRLRRLSAHVGIQYVWPARRQAGR